jgi:hypothetical protein
MSIYNYGVDLMKIAEYVKYYDPGKEDWDWIIDKLTLLWGHKYHIFCEDTNFISVEIAREMLINMHKSGHYPEGQFIIKKMHTIPVISVMLEKIDNFSLNIEEAAQALKAGYFAYNLVSISTYQKIREIIEIAPNKSEYLFKMLLDSLMIAETGNIWYCYVERRSGGWENYYEAEFNTIKKLIGQAELDINQIFKIKIPNKRIREYKEPFPIWGIIDFEFNHSDYKCFNKRTVAPRGLNSTIKKIFSLYGPLHIEGPSGAGKSTVITDTIKQLGWNCCTLDTAIYHTINKLIQDGVKLTLSNLLELSSKKLSLKNKTIILCEDFQNAPEQVKEVIRNMDNSIVKESLDDNVRIIMVSTT